MPQISVIVPVYKAEDFLAECIDSILSQSFSDFEILLVDDGSPDGSGRICDDYAARFEHISVIHQENQGQAAARNHAMRYAKGEWICFVDSDDAIHPQMLELLYKAVAETGSSVSMCEMLEAVSLPENFLDRREPVFETISMDEDTLVHLHDTDRYPGWVACGKLIRKELICHYPFREGRVYEDNEAVCRWICEAKQIAATREMLYFYRGNPDSTTKRAFSLKQLDYLWALESIIGHYRSLGYEKMCQRFAKRYIEAVISCCHGTQNLLERPDVAKKVEKQARHFLRREKIKLTREQYGLLLEVTHPRLMGIYWPVSGAVETIQKQGIAGLLTKVWKLFGKGEGQ